MGKSIFTFMSLFLLLFVLGCNQDSSIEWHDTKEAAIDSGLKHEEAERESVLSIEEFQGETFVFYEHLGGLGVANIVENGNGFGWKRSHPYNDFEVQGELAYSTSGFKMKTESGLDVSILIGKTFDPSIQTMKLLGDGSDRQIKVYGENGFFYALHKLPLESLSVTLVQ